MEVDAHNEERFCVTLQMGVSKIHVNLERSQTPQQMLEILRQHAIQLLRITSGQQSGSANNANPPTLPTPDRVYLFRHDYQSTNMLQLVTASEVTQLMHGAIVEIVVSTQNERPSRPHVVDVHNYVSPTFCNLCGEILVGLMKQGLRCSKCGLNFHKRCVFAPFNNCPAALEMDQGNIEFGNGTKTLRGVMVLEMLFEGGSLVQAQQSTADTASYMLPHTFVVHSYKRPTVCKHCDNLLVGIVKQGLQCRDCKVNVHKKCAAYLPADCRPTEPGVAALHPTASSPAPHQDLQMSETVAALEQMSTGGEQATTTGDQQLIQLMRVPGGAATLQPGKPSVLYEGWQIHFTNYQPERRLRHYWVLKQSELLLYNEGMHRIYRTIPLSNILGVHAYNGPPLDTAYPPHCFEIQTQDTMYYVGENLDWYKQQQQQQQQAAVAQLPRRESGVGAAASVKWMEALSRALLPPTAARELASAEPALEFSQLYQINPAEELGSGQFGTVYGGVDRKTGCKVAVKVIAKERFGRKQHQQLFSEVRILQSVQHTGIVQLLSMFETKDKIFVVMEKMEADMLEMILSSRQGRLDERHTKFLMWQILTALRYLHSKDIAHCDLKPENVLLSSGDTDFPQTKLCDFGYARCIEESQFRNTMVGTPAYLAPEVLQKKGYNKSLDMWSVGVVIYVTLSGTFPFTDGEDIEDQIRNAAFMYPANPWAEISKQAIDMIEHLLKVKIEERYTIDECRAHVFFDDAQMYTDLCELESRLCTVNCAPYLLTDEQRVKYGTAQAQA